MVVNVRKKSESQAREEEEMAWQTAKKGVYVCVSNTDRRDNWLRASSECGDIVIEPEIMRQSSREGSLGQGVTRPLTMQVGSVK